MLGEHITYVVGRLDPIEKKAMSFAAMASLTL